MKAPPSKGTGPSPVPETDRLPGRISRLDRSLTVGLRKVVAGAELASGMSRASWKPNHEDFVLASSTCHVSSTPSSAGVSSRTIVPSALTPKIRNRAACLFSRPSASR